MEILKNIHAVDLSLLAGDTLIISDVHIGFEEALNRQGILVPRDHFSQLIKRMEGIFERIAAGQKAITPKSNDGKTIVQKPTESKNNGTRKQSDKPETDENDGKKLLGRIIVNGDLKHEFGRISEQEWRHTLRFLDFLGRHCEKVVLIKGNHDTVLGPIAEKRGIEIHDHYVLDEFGALVCHGDKLPDASIIKKSKLIIIGHEHPSVVLRSGKRTEKYKCFYLGDYKGKKLIVLPSLNLLTEGSSLMHEEVLSPFLKQDLSDFKVFAVEDEVYSFGKLGKLKHL
jgi:uncharacterized protein